MSKFSLARAVGTTAEGIADAAAAAAAAEDEVGEITLEPKGALQKMVQTFSWSQTKFQLCKTLFLGCVSCPKRPEATHAT